MSQCAGEVVIFLESVDKQLLDKTPLIGSVGCNQVHSLNCCPELQFGVVVPKSHT